MANQRHFTSSYQSSINCQQRCKPPTVKEYCLRSTWHGLSDLYESTGSSRLFWATAIVFAIMATCYGCYAIIAHYLESPVVISYMIHPSEQGRRLPDVVVCPFNRFNASLLEELGVGQDLMEYVQSAFTLPTPYIFQRNQSHLPENHKELANTLKLFLADMGGITFEDFIDQVSFSCSALIAYCIYPEGLVDCCIGAEAVVTPVGKCYRLKGPEQISSGFGFGSTIVIRVPDDKYLSPARNNLHNVGVSIKLAEAGKGLDTDLTFLPAGVHALMPLRAMKFEFINDPPRYECFNHISHNYSSIRCFDDCFFKPGMEKCRCRHITSPNTEYRACDPDEFFHCLVNETLAELQTDIVNYLHKCHQSCVTPCTYWAFSPTVSYAKFPSNTFYQYVDRSEAQEWERTIILDVFYEKLEYTVIKHLHAMTIDTFIANLGGQVGLWIGGSILSLAQFIVFIIHYVCSKLVRANRCNDCCDPNSKYNKTLDFYDQEYSNSDGSKLDKATTQGDKTLMDTNNNGTNNNSNSHYNNNNNNNSNKGSPACGQHISCMNAQNVYNVASKESSPKTSITLGGKRKSRSKSRKKFLKPGNTDINSPESDKSDRWLLENSCTVPSPRSHSLQNVQKCNVASRQKLSSIYDMPWKWSDLNYCIVDQDKVECNDNCAVPVPMAKFKASNVLNLLNHLKEDTV